MNWNFWRPDPLKQDAHYYARLIIKKLEQLDICYRFPKSQRDYMSAGVQRVRIDEAIATPEALYFRIDSLRLPRGVKLADIAAPEVLDDLSVACGRVVRAHRDLNGAWLIVERDSGNFAIPAKLDFGDVLKAWPTSSLKPLLVPLGAGSNKKIQYRSLAEMPHALVGGATGAGKTTFLHSWICALFIKNRPPDLRLALVDLKGGVEFTRYQVLPHLLETSVVDPDDPEAVAEQVRGFVKDTEAVIPLLRYLQRQVDQRLARFEAAGGIQNLAEWNYRRKAEHLPRIVVVIDELAVIMYNPALRKKAVPLLADITARGRAPGIHCVLATQRPEVKVVDGQIKGNTDARFAFRMTDNTSSMVILDTAEAAKFDDETPLGRLIYRRGLDRYEIQAAYLTPGQIQDFIKKERSGDAVDMDAATLPPEQVLEDALTKCNGVLAISRLYKLYEGRVGEPYLRRIAAEAEGRIIEIQGVAYRVVQPGERQARRLIPVETAVGVGESEQILPETEAIDA